MFLGIIVKTAITATGLKNVCKNSISKMMLMNTYIFNVFENGSQFI